MDILGFIERASAGLVGAVVELALLSPSFEVARTVLARREIELDVKTVRRLCQALGQRGLGVRGTVSLSDAESLKGRTLVIGIDGGRLRERRPKRGRRRRIRSARAITASGKNRSCLPSILSDAEGKLVKTFAPLHDATLGDHEALFALLEC